MKRVLFFIENNWVFGKIVNELVKVLYPEYDCDILDWSKIQPKNDVGWMQQKYDLFVSTPVGCFFLHDTYGVPIEKCYGHAHSDFDIVDALRRFPKRYFDRLRGYGVVSHFIAQQSTFRNIGRAPTVLPVGVTCRNYERPVSQNVTRLGYFGRMARVDDTADIKRGYLAQRIADETPIPLVNRENVHFLVAEYLYRAVDLVIFCSTTEGNPYVAMEACAAGLPVLGTNVGIFPNLTAWGAGILLPMPDDDLVSTAVTAIRSLQNEPALYAQMSQAAKNLSRALDWSVVKQEWLTEFGRCT